MSERGAAAGENPSPADGAPTPGGTPQAATATGGERRAGSDRPPTTPRSGGRRLLLATLYLAYVWALVELGASVGLWAMARYRNLHYEPAQIQELITKHQVGIEGQLAGRESYMVPDPELGWVVAPQRSKRRYRSNSHAIRADREYAAQPPPGVLRLAAFGDSFTHASDVSNPATWEVQLEGRRPGLEVLNFGVPGYGPDQALLRYRRAGVAFHPHIVLIGFMSENVGRVVNTFRPFYFPNSGMAFGKPRFELEGAGLALVPNPLPDAASYRRLLADPARELPRIGQHDYYFQHRSQRSRFDLLPSVRLAWVVRQQFEQPVERNGVYNPRSEPFQVSVRILETFYREALRNGSLPVIVLFPQRHDMRARAEHKPLVYQPLVDLLRRRGLRCLDLMGAFDRYDPQHALARRKFIHYPPEGNEMVARYLVDWLQEQRLDTVATVQARLDAERHQLAR